MKAYRFHNADTGLQLQNIDLPQVRSGEVLIAVNAAGLCHSDCHILKGNDWIGKRPITLGHEVAGTIVALGDETSNFQIGDRVAVALISQPVEKLDISTSIGLGYDGGFAEYTTAPFTHVVRIPDNVSFEQAAIATDSISTAYHTILAEANVTSSTTVAIVGLGGLGLNGLRIAALQGARVYGIDISPKQCAAAKELGAVECFASLDSIGDVTIDVIVDFVCLSTTLPKAITAVRQGGRVVAVGLGETEIKLPLFSLVSRGIELKGSIGASLQDLHSALALIASGDVCPLLEDIPFIELIKGLDRLERGDVSGRLFTRPLASGQIPC